jgi:hypothetical protein
MIEWRPGKFCVENDEKPPLKERGETAERLIVDFREALRKTPEFNQLVTSLVLEPSKYNEDNLSMDAGRKGENVLVFHRAHSIYKVSSSGGRGIDESLRIDRYDKKDGQAVRDSHEGVYLVASREFDYKRKPDGSSEYAIGDIERAHIRYDYRNVVGEFREVIDTKGAIIAAENVVKKLRKGN